MKKILFSLLILSFYILSSFTPVAALTYQKETINPDLKTSYSLKRLKEKINLLLKISPSAKIDYYQVLLGKRLAELQYIAETKNVAYIERTSQRYETTAGLLVEYLISRKVNEKKEAVRKQLGEHQSAIKDLVDIFPVNSGERSLILNDFNSLTLYLQKL